MSTQNSQNHKRQEQNNTEWLDELINKIENMKNKVSKPINKSPLHIMSIYLSKFLT